MLHWTILVCAGTMLHLSGCAQCVPLNVELHFPKLWRESSPSNVNLSSQGSLCLSTHTDELAVFWHAAERVSVCESEAELEAASVHTATWGCCWRRANHKVASHEHNVRMLTNEQHFDNPIWCMLFASLLIRLHLCTMITIIQVQNKRMKISIFKAL